MKLGIWVQIILRIVVVLIMITLVLLGLSDLASDAWTSPLNSIITVATAMIIVGVILFASGFGIGGLALGMFLRSDINTKKIKKPFWPQKKDFWYYNISYLGIIIICLYFIIHWWSSK